MASFQLSMPPERGDALLRVSDLTVHYVSRKGSPAPVLRKVSLEIGRGEIVGVLGESGCGKSTLALAILGLLPKDARIEGSINFCGNDLIQLRDAELRAIRGAKISLIHQEPGIALSPVMCAGEQISEVIRAHTKLTPRERKEQAETILREVGLRGVDRIYSAYPHQLSGGELHRIAIAQALVCGPQLVIADEAIRALDVTLQLEILQVLREINQKRGSSLIFITHDPMLLAGFANRCIVMHAGEIVEDGAMADVLCVQRHPQTRSLLRFVREPRHDVRGA